MSVWILYLFLLLLLKGVLPYNSVCLGLQCWSTGFFVNYLAFHNLISQREKTQTSTFFAKTFQRGTFLLFLPLSISSSLRKLLLLHNLSRINTHDKFTLEDAVITEMIGSKLRIFFKSRDARYRSLARVVWACFCYKFSISTTPISSTFLHIIAHWNGSASHNLAKPSSVTYLFLLLSLSCILTRIWGLQRLLTKWG